METVKMPAGLFNSLKGFIAGLPASAFGNTPAASLFDLGKKLDECEVVTAQEAPEKAD